MKKILFFIYFIFTISSLYAQIEVRDSVFILVNKLEPNEYSFAMNDGKIGLVNIYIKNKYEDQSGFVSGYFGSNLTLKQKHKIDPKKILTYDEYVNLINKDLLNVSYYYKVYFIISESKYDYLTLQVRQIVHYEE